MVRPVADSLFEHLSEAFPPTRPYPRARFEQDPMPPLLARFLAQALQQHLAAAADRVQAGADAWFDERHPEVQEAFQALTATLGRHAHIPADAWEPALRGAAFQVVSYLTRPTATLLDFLFEEDPAPVPTEQVRQGLQHFGAYTYLHEVVDAYFEQRSLEEIDRERLRTLLARIDRQMTEDYGPADWVRLLEPLFTLVRAVPRFRQGVPVPLLRTFFAEKEQAEIQQRLQAAQETQQVAVLDAAGLQRLLADAAEPPRRPAGPAAPAAPTTTPAADGPVPLWKKFQQTPPPPAPTPRPPEPPAEPAAKPAADGAPLPLWKRYHAGPAEAEPADAPRAGAADVDALEQAVLGDRGPRNRDLFVKHLFGGSVEAYARTLRRLHQTPTWAQASQIIAQEVFRRHQVNIYSDPAVAFTDAVEAQYR